MDKIAPLDRMRRLGARRHPPPSAKIDAAGADLSGAAGCLHEAVTEVVAWQSDGVSFSCWPPKLIREIMACSRRYRRGWRTRTKPLTVSAVGRASFRSGQCP